MAADDADLRQQSAHCLPCGGHSGRLLAGHPAVHGVLVISQLIQIQRQLEPYSGNAVVAEFLDCLQDALRDQLAFYQLTAEGQHPQEASEAL